MRFLVSPLRCRTGQGQDYIKRAAQFAVYTNTCTTGPAFGLAVDMTGNGNAFIKDNLETKTPIISKNYDD